MNHTWDTFLNTPPGLYVSPAVTLIPVPYDGTTSYRTGSRYGPKAIITASSQLEDYDLELESILGSRNCALGLTTEVELTSVQIAEAEIRQQAGFEADIRHLAIPGLCSDCRSDGT